MKKIMNELKSKNGITLIALVITIIVLLILAGVTIITLTGENGILQRASVAKEETLISQYEEKIELVKAEVSLENDGEVTLAKLKTAFESNSQNDWVRSAEIDNTIQKIILTTKDNYTFHVTENTTEYKGLGDVIVAEMIEFTPTDTTWKATDGTTITNVKQALDSLYGN